MQTPQFKNRMTNAVNRVNGEGGGFTRLGGQIGRYIPVIAALGIVIGLNDSANAMLNYTDAIGKRNWTAANAAAMEAAIALPGLEMQQADLLMKLQDGIEEAKKCAGP